MQYIFNTSWSLELKSLRRGAAGSAATNIFICFLLLLAIQRAFAERIVYVINDRRAHSAVHRKSSVPYSASWSLKHFRDYGQQMLNDACRTLSDSLRKHCVYPPLKRCSQMTNLFSFIGDFIFIPIYEGHVQYVVLCTYTHPWHYEHHSRKSARETAKSDSRYFDSLSTTSTTKQKVDPPTKQICCPSSSRTSSEIQYSV